MTSTVALLLALTSASVSGTIVKRSHDEPLVCSYTFHFLAGASQSCPAIQDTNSLTALQASITTQHANLEDKLNEILARLGDSCSGGGGSGGGSGGIGGVAVNYKRWGRTTCPDNATLIYEGNVHPRISTGPLYVI